MWWPVVFWLLLIPLLIIEIIIFVKTRKFYWLVFALAVFTYVVTVSYTLDVFDADRNIIIATLLASSGIMALIGKHLSKKFKHKKTVSTRTKNTVYGLTGLILIIFFVGVFLGQVTETVSVVESVPHEKIMRDAEKLGNYQNIHILTRHLENPFFLPVPVKTVTYTTCLVTSEGTYNVYSRGIHESYAEVPAYGTKDVKVSVNPFSGEGSASELLVYEEGNGYEDCSLLTNPVYRIPVV